EVLRPVRDDGEVVGPAEEEAGLVEGGVATAEEGRGLAAVLVSVAVGAVDGGAPPRPGEPRDAGQFVHDAGGEDQHARRHVAAVGGGEAEAAVGARGTRHLGLADRAAVALDLGAAEAAEFGGRGAVAGEEAVAVGGRRVAGRARVEHDGAAAGAGQREGGAEAGGAAAHDGGVEGVGGHGGGGEWTASTPRAPPGARSRATPSETREPACRRGSSL